MFRSVVFPFMSRFPPTETDFSRFAKISLVCDMSSGEWWVVVVFGLRRSYVSLFLRFGLYSVQGFSQDEGHSTRRGEGSSPASNQRGGGHPAAFFQPPKLPRSVLKNFSSLVPDENKNGNMESLSTSRR